MFVRTRVANRVAREGVIDVTIDYTNYDSPAFPSCVNECKRDYNRTDWLFWFEHQTDLGQSPNLIRRLGVESADLSDGPVQVKGFAPDC